MQSPMLVHPRASSWITTNQAKDKVESCLLLDVVAAEGISFLELLASKDEALLIGGDPHLVLYLGFDFDIGTGVKRLCAEGVGLVGESLHKDLHAAILLGLFPP